MPTNFTEAIAFFKQLMQMPANFTEAIAFITQFMQMPLAMKALA